MHETAPLLLRNPIKLATYSFHLVIFVDYSTVCYAWCSHFNFDSHLFTIVIIRKIHVLLKRKSTKFDLPRGNLFKNLIIRFFQEKTKALYLEVRLPVLSTPERKHSGTFKTIAVEWRCFVVCYEIAWLPVMNMVLIVIHNNRS